MESNIDTNNIYVGAMLSTIYTTCISCKPLVCYKNRIVRPNSKNAKNARTSNSFWSK